MEIIRKLLREALEEEIQQKPLFARGMEHQLYTSKSDPNVLFKVGYPDIIDRFVSICQSNNIFFPKIFKVGDLTWNKSDFKYIKIEKLDTQKAIVEWDFLSETFEELGVIDYDFNVFHDVGYMFRLALIDNEYRHEVTIKIEKYNQKAHKIFIDWLNFLIELNNIVEPIRGNMVDIHKYNFAYDNSGNKKCIDI